MDPKETWNRRIGVIVFAAILALLSAVFGWRIHDATRPFDEGKTRYLIEDAGISVVFARNIADGEGVVYYPDGERVEGYSNPLWTFMLAGFAAAGVDPWSVPRPAGIAFYALALFFGGWLVWFALEGPWRWSGLLVPWLLGAQGVTIIWATAGLENGMFAAWLLAALALFARERANPAAAPWSAPLFVAAALTRPEGVVYAGFAGLFVIASEVIPARRIERRHLVFAAGIVVPLAAFWLWRWRYFAWPLPMPFYGKVTDRSLPGVWDTASGGWLYVRQFLDAYHLRPPLAIGLLAAASRARWRTAVVPTAATAFAFFFPIYARGDWMREWRFCSTAAALMIPLAIVGAARVASAATVLGRRFGGRWWNDRAQAFDIAAAALAAAFVVALFLPSLADSRERIRAWVKKPQVNTFKLAKRGAYFRKMADRLDLAPGSVGDTDMGGIGAASKMEIVDIGRLCSVPYAINEWHRPFVDQHLFDEARPDFLHARDAWGRAAGMVGNARLVSDYVRLPEEKKLGTERPNGNFVRKDLIVETRAPEGAEPIVFESGVSLVEARLLAEVAEPRGIARLRAVWTRSGTPPADLEVEYALVSENGAAIRERRKPVMDWYPTRDWAEGEYPVDLVKIKIPRDAAEGRYAVSVSILIGGGAVETRPLSLAVDISKEAARKERRRLLDAIRKAIPNDPESARALLEQTRMLRWRGDDRDERYALQRDVARSLAEDGLRLLDTGDEATAAERVVAARKLDHRADAIRDAVRRLAELPYRRGSALMKQGDDKSLDAAYPEFVEALRRDPTMSWARRRAEETRPTGLIRKSRRER